MAGTFLARTHPRLGRFSPNCRRGQAATANRFQLTMTSCFEKLAEIVYQHDLVYGIVGDAVKKVAIIWRDTRKVGDRAIQRRDYARWSSVKWVKQDRVCLGTLDPDSVDTLDS